MKASETMRSPVLIRPARVLPAAAALLALAAALAAAPVALARPAHAAHAYYVRSNPAANAVVKTAPATVTVTFAEPVTPGGSWVKIYDAKGDVVSGAAQVEQNDLATLDVPLTGDGSELYLVVWHTTSATDGDPDTGAFSFFVNASGVSDLAPKTVASAGTSSNGSPAWLVALVGVIGLAIGLGAGVALSRRARGAERVG